MDFTFFHQNEHPFSKTFLRTETITNTWELTCKYILTKKSETTSHGVNRSTNNVQLNRLLKTYFREHQTEEIQSMQNEV